MGKQEKTVLAPRRGPKPTGKGFTVGVRLQPDLLSSLDAYISTLEPKPSRPEAIRLLIVAALARPGKTDAN